MKKRLIIFNFFDKNGIIDASVKILIEDLIKNATELIFVCNGNITPDSKKYVEQLTKNILIRENTGFDAWAFKQGMEYLGWDYLGQFDEILHVNDSCYGPIYPFKEMFNEMDKKDIDFWGITKHCGGIHNPFPNFKEPLLPEHIQTYFTCYRKNMFMSNEFKNYWENLPLMNNYLDAICKQELVLTKTFANMGFKWDVYINTDDLYNYSANAIYYLPTDLLKRRCPVIKKKIFYDDYAAFQLIDSGTTTYKAYEFIKNNTNFNSEIILDNLLRVRSQENTKKILHWNYTLSSKIPQGTSDKKLALIVHLDNEDLIEKTIKYAKSMPKDADIFIMTSGILRTSTEKAIIKYNINNANIITIPGTATKEAAFLIEGKDIISKYDYICYCNDIKKTEMKPLLKGESLFEKCFENTLKNNILIENIIQTFEHNPKLGILTPPTEFHSYFYPTLSNEWGNNFQGVKELCKNLGIKRELEDDEEYTGPTQSIFWFKVKALSPLFDKDWRYERFTEDLSKNISLIYSYIAQEEGYYTGWVIEEEYSKIEITNLFYYLRNINQEYTKKFPLTMNRDIVKTISELHG